MKGLDIYETKDRFKVARLHYTADSEKSSDIAIAELEKGYPGGRTGPAWRKEMEIDFTAYSGQLLCYHIIQRYRNKIICERFAKENDFKFGSVDWGRNNPASFHTYVVDEDKHIHSAFEIYRNDISIPDFCSFIKQSPFYQQLRWISGDPSLWNKTQEEKEGLRSLWDKFRDEGIILFKGKKSDVLPISELLDRWDKLDEREPKFTISPRCSHQIWEFERLRYKEFSTTMIEQHNPSEQLVDKDNHSWDDWKYFISRYLLSPTILDENKPNPDSAWEKARTLRKKGWRPT